MLNITGIPAEKNSQCLTEGEFYLSKIGGGLGKNKF
jgi:hypothetical protein